MTCCLEESKVAAVILNDYGCCSCEQWVGAFYYLPASYVCEGKQDGEVVHDNLLAVDLLVVLVPEFEGQEAR